MNKVGRLRHRTLVLSAGVVLFAAQPAYACPAPPEPRPAKRISAAAPGADGARAALGATTKAADRSPAICSKGDVPEAGIQGDVNDGTVHCGLALLSEVPGGGSVQFAGHCAYVRQQSPAIPYTYNIAIRAYSLADPLKPVLTAELPTYGLSESMRAKTVGRRSVLVSGRGVYDISNCEKPRFKGQIDWPSVQAQAGTMVQSRAGHEIAISRDAKRVYTGLGFMVADISDLDRPDTWTVKNWTCHRQLAGAAPSGRENCSEVPWDELSAQISHSSDDNPQGTRWYGANQSEPASGYIVDISRRDNVKLGDILMNFPGHSMNWWRTADGREFVVGAEEGTGQDTCAPYPRSTGFGNAAEAYIAEVTGGNFNRKAFEVYRRLPSLTMAINRPENCEASTGRAQPVADRPGNFFNNKPSITATSVYNEHGTAMVMMEFGTAGLRVFDLRDGHRPKEVAYFNDGIGYVHSGLFSYDPVRGIIVTSGSQTMQVLVVEPAVVKALGLPRPTHPRYPYLDVLRAGVSATRGSDAAKRPSLPGSSPGTTSANAIDAKTSVEIDVAPRNGR